MTHGSGGTRARETPVRIQRKRTKGWKMPEGAIYVGRPTVWGNPFHIQSDWLLWAGVALGFKGDLAGRRAAAVAFYRWWLTGDRPSARPIQPGGEMAFEDRKTGETFEVSADAHVRGMSAGFAGLYVMPTLPDRPSLNALRGKHLACFCNIDEPCHADVLLEIANA